MQPAFSRLQKNAFCVLLLLCVSLPLQADWSDWWSTPEQKAKAAYEAQDFKKLESIAPGAAWQGVSQHKNEEYEAAAKTFGDIATQEQSQGNTDAVNQALYNKGVSEVRAGQYEQAVQSFDQVLENAPDFADAQHNRDIAQQLIQQQQQQQQQQQSQDGEGDDSSSEDGEQQQDPSGEQSGEQESSEQDESQQQSGEQSQDAGAGSDDDSDASQTDSEAQQEQDEQAARDALEAEAREDAADQNDAEQSAGEQQDQQPMSESEQATEQWLRRIPDDPAGLLRRKLEQSHRNEYPDVRDAQQPW